MDNDKTDRISRRAYELWEAEGRPHGKHDDHWHAAEREFGSHDDTGHDATGQDHADDEHAGHDHAEHGAADPHPGMMGDGTEEQNLDQPGNPAARITQEEVEEAFSKADGKRG